MRTVTGTLAGAGSGVTTGDDVVTEAIFLRSPTQKSNSRYCPDPQNSSPARLHSGYQRCANHHEPSHSYAKYT